MNSYMIVIYVLLQLLLQNFAVVGLKEEELDRDGPVMQTFHEEVYRDE